MLPSIRLPNPGDVPLIKLLLAHGARTDLRDDEGRTILDLARAGKHTQLLRRASAPAA